MNPKGVQIRMTEAGQRGFSLMEVLVALVIVGIALGVLFQVVSGSMRLGFKARKHHEVWADVAEVFERVLPEEPDWERLRWDGMDARATWRIEVHPVAMKAWLDPLGMSSSRDLFKFVLVYRELTGDRTVRLSSYRTVEAGSLDPVLEVWRDRLAWDELERFEKLVRQ